MSDAVNCIPTKSALRFSEVLDFTSVPLILERTELWVISFVITISDLRLSIPFSFKKVVINRVWYYQEPLNYGFFTTCFNNIFGYS